MRENNNLELVCKVETVVSVSSMELEKFIEATFGGSFEWEAIEEMNERDSVRYNISKKGIDTLTVETIEKISKGNYPNYCTHNVLTILCYQGKIQEGTYYVDS